MKLLGTEEFSRSIKVKMADGAEIDIVGEVSASQQRAIDSIRDEKTS